MRYTTFPAIIFVLTAIGHSAEPIDIGSRRELFVDRYLIDKLDGVRLVLHQPQPREVAIRFDQPWEGNTSGYPTVMRDGDVFKMIYAAGASSLSLSAISNARCW